MYKKTTAFLLLLIACMSFGFVVFNMSGCSKSGTIIVGQAEYAAEYGDSFAVPAAVYRDSKGKESSGGITYKVYDAYENEIGVNYGVFYPEIGTYSIIYSGNKTTLTVKVICADTKAPEITLTNFVASTFAGDTYKIPSLKTEDPSGVSASKTVIALYKGNEESPVATGSGETVVIEAVSSYTLKVTVEDKLGNKKTAEYLIAVINPYMDTSLGEGLMFDFDENEYINNIIVL